MDITSSISDSITDSSSSATPPLQRMGSAASVITAEVESKKLQSSKYKGVVPQPNGRWGAQIYEKHQRVWLGTFSDEAEAAKAYDVAAQRFRGRDAITNLKPLVDQSDHDSLAELSFLCSHSKAEIVDMLRKHTYNDELQQSKQAQVSAGGLVIAGKKISPSYFSCGRELLFDKVVTPSDVGKLNRLVIPKQQAEKHFPLKSSSNAAACNGVLINFEDPSGKVWRFRYSYWNSSQSYVLTKGWSRFVKDKGLKAGDAVSFWRSTMPEANKFYIDAKKGATGGCTSGAATQVVKLFGVDISENGSNGKRAREMEAFPQSMFFKKPLIEAL